MRVCNNCGYHNQPIAVFCENCGNKILVEDANRRVYAQQGAAYNKTGGNQNLPLIISIVALVIVVIVSAILLIPKFLGSKPVNFDSAYEGNINIGEETVDTRESFYTVYKSDATWSEANKNALKQGGYLVSINNEEEFEKACTLAEDAGLKVFWVGAKRSSESYWSDVSWLDNTPVGNLNWFDGEPTYYSEEGDDENYLMVFCVDGEWYFNDAINDVSEYYKGRMGYIIETK